MSMSKTWCLACGLFLMCLLVSTVQLSAAMPKSAKQDLEKQALVKQSQAQIPSEPEVSHLPTQPPLDQFPNVIVACAKPLADTHQIAQCRIGAPAK